MNDDELNDQEVLGALSGRLVHTVSNFMAALSGNLWALGSADANEQQRSAALKGAQESARRAAEALDQFSDVIKTVVDDAPRCPLADVAANLAAWRPDWKVSVHASVDESPNCLAGPWKTLKFCLDAIADEYPEGSGSLKVELTNIARNVVPTRVPKPAGYLIINLVTSGRDPIKWEEHRTALRNWKLTAAYQLFSQLGGRPETVTTETGLQRTTVTLPLAAARSSAG